jgi:hypothetical protein
VLPPPPLWTTSTSISTDKNKDEFCCQICGVNLERLSYEQRNEHVNDCIDGVTAQPQESEGDANDFMESPPSQKIQQNSNRKKVKGDEGSISATPSIESIDSQISRCRSRLIEIEGQLAECHYQRVQVNKEMKRLLKKQSLESQGLQSNQIELSAALPVEEMVNATFGRTQDNDGRCPPPDIGASIKQPIDSMEYPLWSLSHQSTLFDVVISQTEPAANGLISLSRCQHDQPPHPHRDVRPSIFSQLEAAVLEVTEERIQTLSPNKKKSQSSLREQFEAFLTAVSERGTGSDGLIDRRWDKLKQQLESSKQLLDIVLNTTAEPEAEKTFVGSQSPIAVFETSVSESFVLSQTQTVVIVSDSDDVPSQQNACQKSPLRLGQENERLHISIDDSPIFWRDSSEVTRVSSPPHSALFPPLEEEVHGSSCQPTTPTVQPSDIFSLPEMPSFSDHSLDQLKDICRSLGLKHSDNPSQMSKALSSLWRRHHQSRTANQPPLLSLPHHSHSVNSASLEKQIDAAVAAEAKMRIRDHLKRDEELYSKILSYQSVDLEHFKNRLRESGLEISSQVLREFFDEEGVFVTSN